MKKIWITGIVAAAAVLALTACGSSSAETTAENKEETTEAAETETSASAEETEAEAADADAQDVTVRIGLTGTFYEDMWKPVAEALEPEGIHLEYVQFSNFSLPNDALNSGDIEMNAFQHHAYLNNEIKNYDYDITDIGDTWIIAMGIYSDKIKDLSELQGKAAVAVPNDATNEGRALKLLESAGLIEIDPAANALPEIGDITKYNVDLEFTEVDANLVYSTLPDVDIAVINGNYAIDSGLTKDDALLIENSFTDNSYFGTIAVRTEDKDNEVYKKIVETFQSDLTRKVFEDEFGGLILPAWEQNAG